MKDLEATAYHHWLVAKYKGDDLLMIEQLKRDAMQQSPQVFDLLEATGDKAYTQETFQKAVTLIHKLTKKAK